MTVRLALLCAGQGGQHPQMFDRLAAEPTAQGVLDRVSAQAGFDVCALGAHADEAAMADNRLAQVLVVGHALAAATALRAAGIEPAVCAGYSVGEMAAHGAAGIWDAEETLALTAQRAGHMDAAGLEAGVPLRMCAVIGIEAAAAGRLAERCGAALAIVNGARHVVVGGPLDAVERFECLAPEHGATHVRRLPVNIASHTRFIAAAAEPFARALTDAHWNPPRATVLSGLDGRAITCAADSVRLLSRQIHDTLHWHECLHAVFEYGVDAVLEIGPGRALTKMVGESFPAVPVRAWEEFRSPSGVAKWLARLG